MKVTVLTNNIPFDEGLESEHGLSLFVETDMGRKILFDTGQTGIFSRNAERLDKNPHLILQFAPRLQQLLKNTDLNRLGIDTKEASYKSHPFGMDETS